MYRYRTFPHRYVNRYGIDTVDIPIINTPMGKQRGKIVFAVDGTTLTGTMDFMGRTYKVESGIATAEGYSYEINAKVMLRRLNAKVRGTRSGDAIEGTLTAPMGSITFNGNKSR